MEQDYKQILIDKIKNEKDLPSFSSLLYSYILYRLDLPKETKEQSLYNLVLYSVRIKMPGEDIKTLESRLSTVDCHQTSYIVSKKTLLMMEIERMLNVTIDIENVKKCDNFAYYTNVLWEKTNE